MSRGLFIQDLGAWMFQRLSLVSTKEMRVFVFAKLCDEIFKPCFKKAS